MKIRGKWLIGTLAAIALVMGAFAAPASAAQKSESPVQSIINQQLKRYPGGTQVGKYEISYDRGNVIKVFPDSSGRVPTSEIARPEIKGTSNSTISYHGCPVGQATAWYCFYEDYDFGGEMLEFKDCSSSGTMQSLAQWGFGGKTTSWVNGTGTETFNGNTTVDVYNSYDIVPMWVEPPDSSDEYVGDWYNDQAEYFVSFC